MDAAVKAIAKMVDSRKPMALFDVGFGDAINIDHIPTKFESPPSLYELLVGYHKLRESNPKLPRLTGWGIDGGDVGDAGAGSNKGTRLIRPKESRTKNAVAGPSTEMTGGDGADDNDDSRGKH